MTSPSPRPRARFLHFVVPSPRGGSESHVFAPPASPPEKLALALREVRVRSVNGVPAVELATMPVQGFLCLVPAQVSDENPHTEISAADTNWLWPLVGEDGALMIRNFRGAGTASASEAFAQFSKSVLELARGEREPVGLGGMKARSLDLFADLEAQAKLKIGATINKRFRRFQN